VIRRVAIMLGVPVVLAVLVAYPLAQSRGPYHWLCAGVALALTVPVGLLTLVIASRSGNSAPFVQVAVLAVGTFARMLIGFGGAVVVFLAAGDTFRREPLVYFAWVLGAYLTTLIVEMSLLGRGSVNLGERRS